MSRGLLRAPVFKKKSIDSPDLATFNIILKQIGLYGCLKDDGFY